MLWLEFSWIVRPGLPIVTDHGDVMVKHLSSHQAKLLLDIKAKVLIVEAKPGSGKTVLALEMARRLKAQSKDKRIAYLCRSKGLASFVEYHAKARSSIEIINPEDTARLTSEYFKTYTDVMIDDAHALPVRTCWSMYKTLFSSLTRGDSHAYIFVDPDFQDYRQCIPEYFISKLRTLAAEYVKDRNIKVEHLGKILRNSQRVCQFANASMEGSMTVVDELSAVRLVPEDGVFFHHIKYTLKEEGLKARLAEVLKRNKYKRRDITILTGTVQDKVWVTDVLKQNKYAVSVATDFPVKRVVVDTLENFESLESPVILFILPLTWNRDHVGSLRYRLCVITRAISRLEFLIPWTHSDRQEDLAELMRAFAPKVNTKSDGIALFISSAITGDKRTLVGFLTLTEQSNILYSVSVMH